MNEIAKRHAEDDEWELSRLTHLFAEWQKNDPGKFSKRIPLQDILDAVGRSELASEIIQDAREQNVVQRLFRG